MTMRETFASRLRARTELVGTFVKSRDPAVVEILGSVGVDFFVLDAEHAPFDRADIGVMAMASRAAGLPMVVRVPGTDGAWIATSVDSGAAGIMVPQVTDACMAGRLAGALTFGRDGLGFSPSTAGAGYGARTIPDHLERHPGETVLICQIEDPGAVANAAAIAAVPGVDALLVGPVDLSVAAGASGPADADIVEMCRATVLAGAEAGIAAGLFLGLPAQAPEWRAAGATLLVVGTDQAFLRRAAAGALSTVRGSQPAPD